MTSFYMGLMSGTSADGIDAVVVDFNQQKPVLLATHYQKLSDSLRQRIHTLCTPSADEINQLAELDVMLGHEFAQAIQTLLKQNQLSAKNITAIGSHGQTIRHYPHKKFTLQIGDPNIIAAETGITVVADFRRRDLACGGQGAPLVPAFHHAMFHKKNAQRIILNIGGIANITVLTDHQPVLGFDTGPGNTLLDAWAQHYLKTTHDDKGAWAKTGKILPTILERLLQDRYLQITPPKSTGKEYFNLAWLQSFLSKNDSPVDVQATLVEFTAQSIANSIQHYCSSGEIFVCGGGVHNEFLMERLQIYLPQFILGSTEKLGIHPDWVEAIAFAWLAKQTLEKKPANMISVTGAKRATILGGVYFAS